MNKQILNTDIQSFIKNNLTTDISSLLLKKQLFDEISQQELVEQIEAKKRCQKKLPTWFQTDDIYYPNKLNIEQTSSEATAAYKADLVSGNSLIDLTGGFGIDCYYFAKNIAQITHCEINENLSEIVQHNYQKLAVKNIETIRQNGIEFLEQSEQNFDWIYIDPSRRNDHKGKVFLLKDCLPNVPEHLDLFFTKSNHVLIKTSPLLDIQNAIDDLRFVKTVYIVALKNEVKEILFRLEKDYKDSITINAVNLLSDGNLESFHYQLDNAQQHPNYDLPGAYLYEPNAAILKSGGFNIVATQFNINKLHQHSHLYSNNTLINFPGRRFKVIESIPYNKKALKRRFGKQQFNITTRNFPKSVDLIRKETQIKDGGTQYLFFTTDHLNGKIVLICDKI